VERAHKKHKWMGKCKDVMSSDQVKIKQLEVLVKEGSHKDLQEDPECQQLLANVKDTLQGCKDWLQLQEEVDFNDMPKCEAILEKGRAIGVNFQEYLRLKEAFEEISKWKAESHRLLAGHD